MDGRNGKILRERVPPKPVRLNVNAEVPTPFILPFSWYIKQRLYWQLPKPLIVTVTADGKHDSKRYAALVHEDSQFGLRVSFNETIALSKYGGYHLVSVSKVNRTELHFTLSRNACPCSVPACAPSKDGQHAATAAPRRSGAAPGDSVTAPEQEFRLVTGHRKAHGLSAPAGQSYGRLEAVVAVGAAGDDEVLKGVLRAGSHDSASTHSSVTAAGATGGPPAQAAAEGSGAACAVESEEGDTSSGGSSTTESGSDSETGSDQDDATPAEPIPNNPFRRACCSCPCHVWGKHWPDPDDAPKCLDSETEKDEEEVEVEEREELYAPPAGRGSGGGAGRGRKRCTSMEPPPARRQHIAAPATAAAAADGQRCKAASTTVAPSGAARRGLRSTCGGAAGEGTAAAAPVAAQQRLEQRRDQAQEAQAVARQAPWRRGNAVGEPAKVQAPLRPQQHQQDHHQQDHEQLQGAQPVGRRASSSSDRAAVHARPPLPPRAKALPSLASLMESLGPQQQRETRAPSREANGPGQAASGLSPSPEAAQSAGHPPRCDIPSSIAAARITTVATARARHVGTVGSARCAGGSVGPFGQGLSGGMLPDEPAGVWRPDSPPLPAQRQVSPPLLQQREQQLRPALLPPYSIAGPSESQSPYRDSALLPPRHERAPGPNLPPAPPAAGVATRAVPAVSGPTEPHGVLLPPPPPRLRWTQPLPLRLDSIETEVSRDVLWHFHRESNYMPQFMAVELDGRLLGGQLNRISITDWAGEPATLDMITAPAGSEEQPEVALRLHGVPDVALGRFLTGYGLAIMDDFPTFVLRVSTVETIYADYADGADAPEPSSPALSQQQAASAPASQQDQRQETQPQHQPAEQRHHQQQLERQQQPLHWQLQAHQQQVQQQQRELTAGQADSNGGSVPGRELWPPRPSQPTAQVPTAAPPPPAAGTAGAAQGLASAAANMQAGPACALQVSTSEPPPLLLAPRDRPLCRPAWDIRPIKLPGFLPEFGALLETDRFPLDGRIHREHLNCALGCTRVFIELDGYVDGFGAAKCVNLVNEARAVFLDNLPPHALDCFFIGYGTMPGGSLVLRFVSHSPLEPGPPPPAHVAAMAAAKEAQTLAAANERIRKSRLGRPKWCALAVVASAAAAEVLSDDAVAKLQPGKRPRKMRALSDILKREPGLPKKVVSVRRGGKGQGSKGSGR